MKKCLILFMFFLNGCVMVTKEYTIGKNYSYEYSLTEHECKEVKKSQCLMSIDRNLSFINEDIKKVELKLKECLNKYDKKEICEYLIIQKENLIEWKKKFSELKDKLSLE